MPPTSLIRLAPLVLVVATASVPARGHAAGPDSPWVRLAGVADVPFAGPEDLTDEVRDGAALVPLVHPVQLGGDWFDAVLVGEGFVHLAQAPPPAEGVLPESLEAQRLGPLGAVGPRVDVLAGPGLRLAPQGRVVVQQLDDVLAVRWTALSAKGVNGHAIAELLVEPGGLSVQYLSTPRGFTSPSGLDAPTATAFRLLPSVMMGLAGDVTLPFDPPPAPAAAGAPPSGCDPVTDEWCDFTGAECTQLAGTFPPFGPPYSACSTRTSDIWRFNEGAFCRDCPYVFYVLVECGRQMHVPTYDMEGLDLRITNMVTGESPDLRCVNQTALGQGPSVSWQFPPNCGSGGPWWSPPLDVTNNAGPGHVVFSDSTPNNGNCTTRFDVGCGALPASGAAPTVVYGEEQTIDCYIEDQAGLCGIYRVEIISGGFGWDLFSNCTGTNEPLYDIYVDCTEAWQAFDPLPELAISNVSATGDCWTYDVHFEVNNIGCVDAPDDVNVRIVSDCGDAVDILVPGPIPAHGAVPYDQPLTLSCPGGTITFTIDVGDFVTECTESPSAIACDAEAGVDTLDAEVTCCPLVSAGADRQACAGQPVSLADAGSQYADAFAWSDGGAGGTFSPSASVRNPTYTSPVPSPASITLTLTVTFSGSGCTKQDSLVLTVNPPPALNAGPDLQTCRSEAVALAGASGGTADSFSWSDGGAGGAFSPSASVLSPTYANAVAGTYALTLTGTDAPTGCSATDQRTVVVHPLPAVSAGPDAQTCAGEQVQLDDAAGGTADSFSWSDGGAGGAFTPSATVLAPTYSNASPGTHVLTLTGTDAPTGCKASDSLSFVVHPDPAVSAGSDKRACVDGAASLADAAAGAADAFSWSDGGAGGTFAPSADVLHPTYANPTLGPHVLTLTATETATGCTGADTVVVTVDPEPVVDAGGGVEACAGAAAALDEATAGTADTFQWSDGGEGGSFTPNPHVLHPSYSNAQSGTYVLTLTATDSSTGCDASDSLEIEVGASPLVAAGSDKQGCAQQPVPLDDAFASGGTTVSWSDGAAGGTFSPSPTVLEPTYANAAGSYTLTLTATRTATGCVASDSMLLTLSPAPAASAGADKQGCAGAGIALSDSSAAAALVHWSDGGSGGSFLPSADVLHPTYSNPTPGSYALLLRATSAAGCVTEDGLSLVVNANPSMDAGPAREACTGQPVALGASSTANQFAWSDGGTGGAFSPSAAALGASYSHPARGTYTLTLVATSTATGCSASDTTQVTVRALPIPQFQAIGGPWCEDTPVCFDNTSVDGTSWLWSFGAAGGGTSAQQGPCFVYAEPGTYTVTLTATNVCGSAPVSHQVVIAPKPVAEFAFSTQGNKFCKNKNVNFTDQSTNAPTAWSWDFGDGTTSTAQNPVHAFTTDGVFLVTLVACNSCGCGLPKFETLEIAATCQANCEANSNQIECAAAPATVTGNTCTSHDSFNTTSYPCAPGFSYTGENRIHDLNFAGGSNFIVRLTETQPEPNGYELDLMISDNCNPPNCVAWGDTEVLYSDRTAGNDDYWLIVDGRNGTCGPYTIEVECLDSGDTAACAAPDFDGVVQAGDLDPCAITGILVEWDPITDWGLGPNGLACDDGVIEVWRALASDPTDQVRVGSAPAGATSFVDTEVVPRLVYRYRVHAVNSCCGEVALTTAFDDGEDDFTNTIQVDAGTGGSVSCDAPVAQLLGSASGGTGEGFDISWSPTAGLSDPTVPNPVATLPGVYTMTATDVGDGCSASDVVVVTSDAEAPLASAGPDRVLTCSNGSVQLAGSALGGNSSAGYAYSWTPAGSLDNPTSATPTTATPGTYTLTVEAVATGCTDTDTVVVSSSTAPPAASAGPNRELTCSAAEVTLEGSASGGDGSAGYGFSWSPASGVSDATAASPTTSFAGAFTLLVTDLATGCTDTDVVVVISSDAAPAASAGPDRQLGCLGGPVTLNGNASGGDGSDGYLFAWSPPDAVSDPAAEDPTTSVPGTYVLTVTDVHSGCTGQDSVVVAASASAPTASAGPDRALTCNVALVTLAGSASGGDGSQGYSFSWSPAGQVSNPASPTPTTSTPGTYSLVVTSVADGCVGVDAVTVAAPAPPEPSAGPDRAITCGSGAVTLQGSATGGDASLGRTWSWSPAGLVSNPAAQSPTTSTPGTYALTVTDAATGCSDTDTVVVASDFVAPTAAAGPDRILTCAVAQVLLAGGASGGNGSAGWSFSWAPAGLVSDASAAQPTTSTPGSYTLTVTDLANGCTDTDVVQVAADVAAPVAAAGPDVALACAAASVPLVGGASGGNGSAGYSFHWEPAGAVTAPDSSTTGAEAAGTYTLAVTDLANGCTDEDTVVVTSPNAPIAGAGPDGAITCSAASAVLQGAASGGNGSQGYLAEWTPAAGVADPTSLSTITTEPGTYALVVTDVATGCSAQDVVVVADQREAPTAAAGPDRALTCAQPAATLTGSASGGNGASGYAFAWTPAALVSNPIAATTTTSTPGAYTLTVTDLATGCTDGDTVFVADDRAPPTSSAGPDQQRDCAFTAATLAGSASGGDGSQGYSYQWSPAGSVASPTAPTTTTTTAGVFTLTVTDVATGCTDADTVTVIDDFRQPVANAGSDGAVSCDQPLAQLSGSASGGSGAEGYDFHWEPVDEVSNPASATPVALGPGTYALTVTDRANGCSGTDVVVVANDAQSPVSSAGPDQVLGCGATGVTLQGSASGGNASQGYAYSWQPASEVSDPASPTPTATSAGIYSLTVTAVATGCTHVDAVVVTHDLSLPVASAGPDGRLDCDTASVLLQGSATGGNASQGRTFSWSPVAGLSDPAAAQPTATLPGTYTLTVTSVANGCSDTDEVIVVLDDAVPVADAGPAGVLDCVDQAVTLAGSASGGNGSAGWSFAWSPAAQVADAAAAVTTTQVAGTYTLTVTDLANGCTDVDTVVVTSDPQSPTADAGPDRQLDCDTSLVTLQGSASGGNGSAGYSFAWSPAGLVSNPTIAQPSTSAEGTYTLTVTDLANGCTDADTVVVVRDLVQPTANAGPDRGLDCDTPSVTLLGAAAGGNASQGYAYSWTPVAGLSDPTAAQPSATLPGTYTLTVTALATGCADVDTVGVSRDIQAPVASAGADKALDCQTTTVTLDGAASGGNGAAGFTYSWQPAQDVSDATLAEPTTSVAGTYTLTVTDLANGCVDTDTVQVAQDVAQPIANAGADAVLTCGGAGVTLSGSASGGNGSLGYSVQWEPAGAVTNASSLVTTAIAAATFTLTVTDLANGCTGEDVVVVSGTGPTLVADAGPADAIRCNDGEATLQGTASGGNGSQGYVTTWSPAPGVGDTAALVTTTTEPGTYTLLVEDVATGCLAADVVVIADDRVPPEASAGPDRHITCAAGTVALAGSATGGNGSAGWSYSWSPAGPLSDAASATPTTQEPGSYTLVVTDLVSGCTDADVVVVVDDREAPVADAGPTQPLGCTGAATLQGSASGGNATAGYAYSWSPAGQVSDPTSPSPTTTATGQFTLTVTALATGCTDTDTTFVVLDTRLPEADAGPDRVLTCTGPVVTLSGSATGGNGTAGYAFSWSPAGSVSDAAAAAPTTSATGTYQLTVTDLANGCTDTDFVVVTADVSSPVADAGADVLMDCTDPSAPLSGSASGGNGSLGYTFRWEPAGAVTSADTAVTEALATGTFTLIVTDVATGCTDEDEVVVDSSQVPPSANAGPDGILRCDRPTSPLLGSASGGDGRLGYAAEWTPSAGVANPNAFITSATIPGSYTLTVTDVFTGCRSFDTVEIVDDDTPPIADAGPPDTLSCDDLVAQLQGSASGGNGSRGYGFHWEPAASVTDPDAQATTTSTPGTYTLTVTDRANGCSSTDTVVIGEQSMPPIAEAGIDQLLTCSNNFATLTGSASGGDGSAGYTYRWSPASQVSDPDSAVTITTTEDVYTLTVTDVATGCTGSDSVQVFRDRARPQATAGPDRFLDCANPIATLLGGVRAGNPDDFTFQWTPAANVADPAARVTTTVIPGVYTLLVTSNLNGCVGADTVTVFDRGAPPIVSAGPDHVLTCLVSTVALSGSASGGDGSQGYQYSWSPAGPLSDPTSPTPTTSTPGDYTLTVTDVATGCAISDLAWVVLDRTPPVADAGPDRQLGCASVTAPLTGAASGGNGTAGYSFSWTPAGGVLDPDAAVTEAFAAGTYTLTVTDLANGCTSSDAVVVTEEPGRPTASAGSDAGLSCVSPIATLSGDASGGDGSQGYTFSWTPAAGVSNPTAAVTTTSTPGTYVLTVTAVASGCRAADSVDVAAIAAPTPPEPSALDVSPGAPPLTVAWTDRLRTQLEIEWENVGALAYRLHAGSIPALRVTGYTHAPVACGLATENALIAPPPGSVYFLAVAVACDGGESSYGRAWPSGAERLPASPTCP